MVNIEFIAAPTRLDDVPVRRGRITLGDFAEEFESPLTLWTSEQYEAQWHAAADRVVRGERTSGFIVWATDLPHVDYALWWPMWREGNRIVAQNQLLVGRDHPRGINLEAAYDKVHFVEAWEEPDGKTSKWYLDVSDFEDCLRGSSQRVSNREDR
jgi:contact-dependent growth inhibition (CDI) system CdiI-like immunity protein